MEYKENKYNIINIINNIKKLFLYVLLNVWCVI